jgi:aldehyde dehydrogenase (NAD+)
MLRFADLIDKHAPELGLWETKSIGQPIGVSQWMYKLVSGNFRYMSGWTNKVPGEQWPEEDGIYKVSLTSIYCRHARHKLILVSFQIVQYEPVGVCAGIGAWNGAGLFFGFKTAPAVAAGCTFIFKPSEKSPIGTLQIGELIKEAGFPPGVINIINGDGKVGAALASHMDVNKISFTGSVFAGKKVQELAAKRYVS